MKKIWWAFGLTVIILLAGFLYFYKLGEIPNGVYVDEATIAYNANSILQTGKDEYGFVYPLVFRLMGSYSPPLFIYIGSYLTKFFGPWVLTFRSVTAIGVLVSVICFFLLARKMALYKLNFSYWVTTLFFSISPWIVFNARLGYETTFGFVVFSIGAYFLFAALEKPKNLITATLFFSIASYISYNQRLLGPIFLVAYVILFRKIFLIKENIKIVFISVVVGLITQIPNLTIINTQAFWTKSNQFSINYFWTLLTYLSPKTLFYENPDIDLQHTIPKLSVMYNFLAIPYMVGVYHLTRKLKDQRYKFLLAYGALTVIPPVFGSPFVSTQRTLPFVVPLMITVGLGLDEIFVRIRPIIRYIVLVGLIGYSLLILYSSYFVLFPKERANAWNYGYDQIASYVKDRPNQKFLIDDTRNPRAYILFLYFLKVDPGEYQEKLNPVYRDNYYKALSMADSFSFRNVEVRQIDWREDPKRDIFIIGDDLAVSDSQIKEHGLTQITEFKDPLMNTIFKVYKTNFRR